MEKIKIITVAHEITYDNESDYSTDILCACSLEKADEQFKSVVDEYIKKHNLENADWEKQDYTAKCVVSNKWAAEYFTFQIRETEYFK